MLRPGSRVKLPVQCVADGRCSLLYKEFRSHYLTELIVPVPRRGNRCTEGGPLAKVTQQVTDDLSPRPVSTVPHAELFPGVNGRGRSPWGCSPPDPARVRMAPCEPPLLDLSPGRDTARSNDAFTTVLQPLPFLPTSFSGIFLPIMRPCLLPWGIIISQEVAAPLTSPVLTWAVPFHAPVLGVPLLLDHTSPLFQNVQWLQMR